MKMKNNQINKIYIANWRRELQVLKKQKRYRELRIFSDKRDFSSNDYLSLSGESMIRRSLLKDLKQGISVSIGSSRLLRGHSIWHKTVENTFQQYVGGQAALFFNSGYMANMGLISTLAANKDITLFSDQLNHASLIEGCRLSRAPCHIYPHKDINQLECLLKKSNAKNKIIITESLFSMDGDRAPLEELSDLALRYRALCIVDEAHAIGLYGKGGGGFCTLLKEREHIIRVYPCGKALSATGAFIVGPKILKEYLVNKCQNFIYTTAASPFQMCIIQHHLNFLKQHSDRRKLVRQKAQFFRSLLQKGGLCVLGEVDSPIVPVLMNPSLNLKKRSIKTQNAKMKEMSIKRKTSDMSSNTIALALARFLQNHGYDIRAIRFPTVPSGSERVRITIHYNHSKKELKELAQNILNWAASRR